MHPTLFRLVLIFSNSTNSSQCAVALPIALQLSAHVASLVLDTTLLCGHPSSTPATRGNSVVLVLVSSAYLDTLLSNEATRVSLREDLAHLGTTARVLVVNLNIPAHLWPPPTITTIFSSFDTFAVDDVLSELLSQSTKSSIEVDTALPCLPYETTL